MVFYIFVIVVQYTIEHNDIELVFSECVHLIFGELLLTFRSKCHQSREGNLVLAKLYFSTFIWNVWKERNHPIFRASIQTWQVILKKDSASSKNKRTFLNLDGSSSLATGWDLPPSALEYPLRRPLKSKDKWDLLISCWFL